MTHGNNTKQIFCSQTNTDKHWIILTRLFFLMKLELSETLKLSTIPVLPITSSSLNYKSPTWKESMPFAFKFSYAAHWKALIIFQTFRAWMLFFSGEEAWNVWKLSKFFSVLNSKANGHWLFNPIPLQFSALRQLALVKQ